MSSADVAGLRTSDAAKRKWREKRSVAFRTVLAPPPTLTISEWSDKYRILSSESAANAGPWRTDNVPYLKEIMDACGDLSVERVVGMKAAQLGFTEGLVNNVLGYYIHQDPSPILVVQPTTGEAEKYSKEKLAPMIRDNPEIRSRIREARSRDSENTILAKAFPGGHLGITGAESPKGLRSRTRRILLADEVDGYTHNAGGEGDPVMLAEKRTTTYWNRKIVLFSTPTIKGLSRIEKAFEESDQRKFFCPCPHCGHEQVLLWGGEKCAYGLKWDSGKPETATYMCEACECLIDEADKPAMVRAGRWIAQNPGHPTRGYWLNSLVSLFDGARWSRLVSEFLQVKHDPIRLRVFVNTVLAESWEDEGQQVDANILLQRMEEVDNKVPAWAAVLTRSVDVQGDRLETAVWAWGPGARAMPIEMEIIPGDPSIPEAHLNSPWRELSLRIRKTYTHASGVELRPAVTFIDSGYQASQVYAFTRPRQGERVFSIKGHNAEAFPLLGRPTRNNSAKAILYMVGSFTGRELLMSRLAKIAEPGPGYIHIPDWMDGEQLNQLTAEKLVTRIVGGRPKRIWVKQHERNEQTDLFIIALAALQQLGPKVTQDLEGIARRLNETAATPTPLAQQQGQAKPVRRRILSRGIE